MNSHAPPRAFAALCLEDYLAGVRGGDRAVLARAITLVESTRPEHRMLAQELLQTLLPETGRAHRIGITGVPGVGKVKARRAMEDIGIADTRRLRGLGDQQRARLLEMFG